MISSEIQSQICFHAFPLLERRSHIAVSAAILCLEI